MKPFIYPTEYLTIKDNKNLIGKRARFKRDERYTRQCWGKTGVIVQNYQVEKGDLDHVGISLKFDEPLRTGYKDSMVTESLYIMPNSITLIKESE